jgi:hypothetical protein
MISQARGIIAWVDDVTFAVLEESRLCNEIFPRYFKKNKHDNLNSFKRQLGHYGFTKTGDNHWRHSEFKKSDYESVYNMPRKKSVNTQQRCEDSVPSTVSLGEQWGLGIFLGVALQSELSLHNPFCSRF